MRSLFLGSLAVLAVLVWWQGLFMPTPALLQFLGFSNANNTESVYFVGDVFLGRDVARRMEQYGPTYPFSGDVFPDEPYIIGNFESAAPLEYDPTEDYTFRFNVRQAYLSLLHTFGYRVISLANNHAFDAGTTGYQETVAAATEAGLVPVGPAPAEPYTIIEQNGTTIALVAVGLVSRPYEPAVTLPVIQEASKVADQVLVYVHWGDEYELVHNVFQEQVATDFAEAGADVVVGHHPHVVQDIQYIDDTLVFYSLGNFIFDQYFSTNVQQGLVLELKTNSEALTWSLIPVTSEGTYIQPNRLAGEERTQFLAAIANRSAAPLRTAIAEGTILQPVQ